MVQWIEMQKETQRLYQDQYPVRCIPDRETFEHLLQQLCEVGTFTADKKDTDHQRNVRISTLVEDM